MLFVVESSRLGEEGKNGRWKGQEAGGEEDLCNCKG